jgi:hypothetical protein
MRVIDLKNQTVGLWKIIERVDGPITKSKSKPAYWKCKCKCGTVAIIPSHNLRSKNTLSCGCRNQVPAFQSRFNRLQWISNERGIKCAISFSQFQEFTKIKTCHYCHAPIEWKSQKNAQAYHLDRKDSSAGYIIENCVVCCTRCNMGKSDRYTYDEWYKMNDYFRNLNRIS